MSSDVTIVLPTHFRHAYLARSLEMYADSGIPIIVADSTSEPFEGADKYENVTYCHCPEKGAIEKLYDAIQDVETPYVVMRADKRHLIPDAIKECVGFLENNSDYSHCHGVYIAVERPGGILSACPQYYNDCHKGVVGETPSYRIMEVWDRYVPSYYSVSRVEIWKRVLEVAVNGITNFFALEILQAMFMAMEGKGKRLLTFYGANQIAKRVDGGSEEYEGFDVFATAEKYADEFAYLISSAADRLAELENIGQGAAKNLVVKSIARYLEPKERGAFIKRSYDLDERALIMKRFLVSTPASSQKKYFALMEWLESWKDEI